MIQLPIVVVLATGVKIGGDLLRCLGFSNVLFPQHSKVRQELLTDFYLLHLFVCHHFLAWCVICRHWLLHSIKFWSLTIHVGLKERWVGASCEEPRRFILGLNTWLHWGVCGVEHGFGAVSGFFQGGAWVRNYYVVCPRHYIHYAWAANAWSWFLNLGAAGTLNRVGRSSELRDSTVTWLVEILSSRRDKFTLFPLSPTELSENTALTARIPWNIIVLSVFRDVVLQILLFKDARQAYLTKFNLFCNFAEHSIIFCFLCVADSSRRVCNAWDV